MTSSGYIKYKAQKLEAKEAEALRKQGEALAAALSGQFQELSSVFSRGSGASGSGGYQQLPTHPTGWQFPPEPPAHGWASTARPPRPSSEWSPPSRSQAGPLPVRESPAPAASSADSLRETLAALKAEGFTIQPPGTGQQHDQEE